MTNIFCRENEQNRAQLLMEAVKQYVRPASESENLGIKCASKEETEIVNVISSEKVEDSKKSENCSTTADKLLCNESMIKERTPNVPTMTSEDEELIQSEMALVDSELQTLV